MVPAPVATGHPPGKDWDRPLKKAIPRSLALML